MIIIGKQHIYPVEQNKVKICISVADMTSEIWTELITDIESTSSYKELHLVIEIKIVPPENISVNVFVIGSVIFKIMCNVDNIR